MIIRKSPGGKIISPGGKNLTRRENNLTRREKSHQEENNHTRRKIISPVLLPMLVTRGNKSTLGAELNRFLGKTPETT